MSYDLAVIAVADAEVPDREIRRRAFGFYDVEDDGIWPEGPVGELLVELLHRWPPLHVLAEDQLDASPWSGEISATDEGAIMSLAFSRADEVRFAVLALAARHHLAVVDFQVGDGQVFLPVDTSRLLVTTEGHGSFPWVSAALLDWLTADLRPGASWLNIEQPDGAYAQSKRVDDGYLLEVRTGGPETHIGTKLDEPAPVSLRLLQFARHDPAWRSGPTWEPVKL